MLFRWRYVEHAEPEYTSADMVFGQAIHHAIAECHRSGSPLTADVMLAHFEDYWQASMKHMDDLRFRKPQDELVAHAKGMCQAYATHFGDVQADEVELLFEVPLIEPTSGMGSAFHSLTGCIDMIADGVIYEFKTAARSHSQKDADQSIQLTAYALAYEYLYGGPARALRLVTLTKTKTPKVQVLETTRRQKDYQLLVDMAEGVIDAVESDVFYRNVETLYGCNSCAYHARCFQAVLA